DPSGSYHANDPGAFRPEPSLVGLCESPAGDRDRLAREACCDEVNWLKLVAGEFSDVAVLGNVRPVLGENLAAKLIDLPLPCDGHAGSLQSQLDSAYTAEQAPD